MEFCSVDDLKAALGQPGNQFVDVRTPDEFRRGHIQGFVSVPMGTESEGLRPFDKKAPTYVVCLSGGRSLQACATLVSMGFGKIRNVQGGMLTWRGKGFPVVA